MKCKIWLLAPLVLVACLLRAAPAIETAGELFVDLDAANLSPGSTTWTNAGSYTDFSAVGAPTVTLDPVPAVFFDGSSAFVGQDAAPDGLVGFDPTRSVEVWAFNPSIAAEETLVSWGKRGGPEGSNMSFNYGNHGNFGAVGHWGGNTHDMGWIDNDFTPGAPEAGQWHHLVYTYDEAVTRVYADGELWNEEETLDLFGGLDTHVDTPIAIASQWEPDGQTLTGGLRGSLFISRVRIHDDVLTDGQILSNYNEERGGFTEAPVIPPPPAKPDLAGLWRFDDPDNLGRDASPNENHLSPSGGVSPDTAGKYDGAGSFDGFDGMLTADEFPADVPTGDSPYTIAAWIQPDETGARGIVGWGAYGSARGVNAFRIKDDNGFRHYWWGADLDAEDADVDAAGVDLDDGQWHHAVAVYDGEERSLYLNGELLVSDTPGANNAVGENFAIGRTCTFCGDGEFFSGRLDDVAIFNIALDQEAIQTIMSGDFSAYLTGAVPGDFDGDGIITAADIDQLAAAIRTGNQGGQFDLDGGGDVNEADLDFIVRNLLNTWFGDANLDGEFNTADFVQVFQIGQYEDDVTGNSGWTEGDWNGDGDFTSGDLVAAFQDGGFEQGPRAAVAAVPEPSSVTLLLFAFLGWAACARAGRFSSAIR